MLTAYQESQTYHACAIDAYHLITLQSEMELWEFQQRAKAIISDGEREAAIVWIAEDLETGTSLGGELRKVHIP